MFHPSSSLSFYSFSPTSPPATPNYLTYPKESADMAPFQQDEQASSCTSIILHPLADLSSSYPPVFVCDLKQNFIHGKGKSTAKFHAVRKMLIQSLSSSPPPGPATFVIRCLEALTFMEAPYSEGLGHLLTSALNHVSIECRSSQDSSVAKGFAASLISMALRGERILDDRIIVKTIEVFKVQMSDMAEALNETLSHTEALLEPLVINLITKHSYNGAMSLIKHLHLHHYASHEFLARMVDAGDLHMAGQWASHLGKDMLCYLVQHCTNNGMFKEAYKYVQHYQLSDVFPEARHLYKRSSLPTVLVKGLWDRAGSNTDEEHLLSEHWRRISQSTKDQDDEERLCDLASPSSSENFRFLQLSDIIPVDKVVWVDSAKELEFAATHLSGVSMVGIDCEWKATRIEGSWINKVSILQMATREFVFVLDLVNLSQQERDVLNACIQSVFSSPTVLKLGYAVYNDLEQLLQSYSELECFHRCESVLDLQLAAGKGIKGGLSGLAKVVFGKSMDKQMRMTDWERRPLSTKQLQYAALDAAVLLSIFDYIDSASGEARTWKLQVDHFKAQKTYLKSQYDQEDPGESSPSA